MSSVRSRKRRNVDLDRVDPIQQVLAKALLVEQVVSRDIGRGDDPSGPRESACPFPCGFTAPVCSTPSSFACSGRLRCRSRKQRAARADRRNGRNIVLGVGETRLV